ncbi:restriction endonuclease subunit S [Sideroxydans lithotrophicus]|uniref:Restriction modification system DNA specificity domain protein n=1 Tax=Sideroxydans lithotrophicus (strain ES-1) TaxID=580332 RepID=D5CMI9_SIDLE|nr:restriction endonuclease subunit S [Sideroxydans lithotrophicus]ADE12661.1 restriction modification system DNA specificity domain protein [Sideroxydans lithotrophicus ES-1]
MTQALQRHNHVGRLKDFCQVGDGAHASIARQEHGVMYLSAKNFKSSGLDLSNVDYISEGDYEKHFGKTKKAVTTPVKGDVLFGIIGSLGTPYTVKHRDRFGLSSSVAILRPSSGLCPDYLYHFMTSSAFQSAVHAIKSGVAQGFLSLEMVKNLPLVTHEINVQRKIAAILSAYDELIDNNQHRIALLERMAEEIYREWFVRMRFHGYEKTTFNKGLPSDWEICEIGRKFATCLGGTPSRAELSYWGGEIPWINSGEVNKLRIVEASEYLTEDGLRYSATKIMPRRTTVIAITGATLGQVSLTEIAVCANQSVVGVYDSVGVYSEYIFQYVKTNIENLIAKQSGGGQQHINKDIVEKEKILLPPPDLIGQYNQIVRPIFDQIRTLMFSTQGYTQVRDRLLPRLISGKLSVENLDIQFPPSMREEAHA